MTQVTGRDGCGEYRVSAIVLNYNTREPLGECLRSLAANHTACDMEIIVVDNRSADGSADMVRRDFPHVEMVRMHANLGFAAGMNAGILRSTGDLLLLLNADTVLPPGSVDRLVSIVRELPQVGIAGPRLVDVEGGIQDTCQYFPLITPLRFWRFLLRLMGAGTGIARAACRKGRPESVEWLHGACLLVRREMLEEVGLFDEGYFIYGEDMDLCFRARGRGWTVVYIPEVVVVHLGGRSAVQVLGAEGSYPLLRARMKALHRFWYRHLGARRAFALCALAATGSLAAAAFLLPVWLFPLRAARGLRRRCLVNLRLGIAGLSILGEHPRSGVASGAPERGCCPAVPASAADLPPRPGAERRPWPPLLGPGPPRAGSRPCEAAGRSGNGPGPDRLVVVLAHDEEASVGQVIEETREHVGAHIGAHIIVVDDGSRDRTRERALAAGAECLSLPRNQGVGNAERTAFREALLRGFAAAARLDGDGQHDPAFLPLLFRVLEEEGADLVIGSRYRDGGGPKGMSPRRLGTRFFSFLVSRLLGARLTDATCGMRAYSRQAMRVLLQFQPDHYPEIAALLIAGRFGLRIAEVPLTTRERSAGSSHLKPLTMAGYAVVNLGRMLYYRWGLYPAKKPNMSGAP